MRCVFALLALLALSLPAFAAPSGNGSNAERYLQTLKAQAPHQAAPPLDPAVQPLARELAQRYGVTVLDARREELDGKPVYLMAVMRPGGDFDDAYAVRTLVVDAASGALVPQFRSETSGYALALPPDRTPRDNGVATTIRRESFAARHNDGR